MVRYTCPKEGCPYVKEVPYTEAGFMEEIFEHERMHKAQTREVTKTEKETCDKCNGKGYIERVYIIEEDVSKTNSGRNK